MLTIAKLVGARLDYYLRTVADGLEDYYLGSGEAPGYWLGTGTALLGLSGEVAEADFRAVFAGDDRRSGRPLVAGWRGRRVPGFDLTFSTPKGVSLLFALADPDVSAAVRDAHDIAVADALSYLERAAGQARRGHGGATRIGGRGFVAAAFRHRTSRAGDPQLHTHVLLANLLQGADGTWGAIFAQQVYRHAKTAGVLYQARLRAELARTLGVELVPVDRGLWELAGIPRALLRHFSTRRVQIEQRLEERGESSRAAAQVAALATRQAKDPTATAESLFDQWRARAVALGFGPQRVRALLGRVRPAPAAFDGAAVVRLLGADGLTAHRSWFTRRDLLQAVAGVLPRGARAAEVEWIADSILRSAEVARLLGAAGEPRWSTPEMLAVEAAVLDTALARQTAGVGIAADGAVGAALAKRPELSAEQVEMICQLVSSGAGVEVVVGKAGAGKTFALDAARDAWQTSGHQVVGAALAARAAAELESGAGIPSSTIARLLRHAETSGLGPGTVLVVDEAGMVGTRTLARILTLAEHADAKVVLVGDPRQLPEIAAGGAYAALATRLGAITLGENRRQHEEWERAALDELRHGDLPAALDAYRRHGRIVTADTAPEVRQRMVADWWTATRQREDGPPPVMLALRRADVAELNGRARALMAAAGRLGTELTVHTPDGPVPFAVGDVVVGLRNDYRSLLRNGSRGLVEAVGPRGLVIRLTDGRHTDARLAYLTAGHLGHGYAITVHKAQGMTTGRVHLLGGPQLYREAGYVGLSRGRISNRLYVVAGDLDPDLEDTGHGPDLDGPDEDEEQRLAALRDALEQSRAQQLALDQTGSEPEKSGLPDGLVVTTRHVVDGVVT